MPSLENLAQKNFQPVLWQTTLPKHNISAMISFFAAKTVPLKYRF